MVIRSDPSDYFTPVRYTPATQTAETPIVYTSVNDKFHLTLTIVALGFFAAISIIALAIIKGRK